MYIERNLTMYLNCKSLSNNYSETTTLTLINFNQIKF
jgi:hypothetical protein